jgi:DNA polymerase III subunit alpha
MSAEFVHLHVHSEYSLIDSTIRVGDLVDASVRAGMPAVALTDQSNLFALVKFYKAAEAAGIKPIAGCDLWVGHREDRAQPQRLTVLCQNHDGYLNLSRLLSRAYAEGRHGEIAIVDIDWLDHANAGLIALAGRDSEIGRLLIGGRDDYARARAERMRARFPDRFYLEVSRTHRPNEDVFLDGALALAETFDLPIVATNDVRFLTRDDFEAHEARVCIHAGRVLADPKRPRDYSAEQYLKSSDEMATLFSDLPELIENSVELAKRCNLELSFGKYFLPAFPVPAEHTLDSFIRTNARAGLVDRLAKHPPAAGFTREEYEQRLELELDVILQMGFPGYFLIVADFINWAKQHDIPVGPGRGSGAGSLVAYALGITDLDPLQFDLLFERFLNPERVSMPDFDVDFCMDRRDEVIDYVAEKYGRDRVSQIITYGTMAAKAVLRDTGRVLGMPYGQVDRIAKLLPKMPLDLSLEDALGRSEKSRKEPDRVVSEFKALYASDEEVKELVDLALKLEDLTRNAGKHAGGVVIAPGPLSDYAPLFSEGGGDGLVTQFDKDDVEAVGLVKFDFLGLRTLTIIDWAVKAINRKRAMRGEAPIDIATLPMNDAPSYALLKRCQTTAVFQLESRGMRDLVKKLQPDNFEDVIALVALFRPGPLQSGMVDDFIARKHGRAEVSYPHPLLEPILKPTYGVIVYQEQVMQIAQVLAGYSLGGADLLRRAMGKKKAEEMALQRVTFEDGAANNAIEPRLASAIFDLMEKFAEYGFNKSHSAAYALVAYQTAWLKAHYPAEFMAAVLSADMDNTDKVVNFLAEARAMQLVVQPPDINASNYMFEAQDDRTIVYGLGAVKGVGRGAVESIVEARAKGGAFKDIADFCRRIDAQKTNKRVLEALILSGSMDALAPNRASLMLQLPEAVRAAEQNARDAEAGQHDIFGAIAASAIESTPLPTTSEWPIERKLAGERETLGHYLSGHPTDAWRGLIARIATSPIGEIDQHYKPPAPHERRGRFSDQSYTIAGQVIAIRKRGDAMAFVQVEDFSGRIEVSLFREAWVEYGPLLTRDAILVFDGGLSFDDFSGNYQLRVNSVATIETACERTARMLRVKLNGVHGDFIARLQHALAAHRGGMTPVRLTYHNGRGQADIELGAEWRVRATPALKDSLQALDGVVAAELVFG